MFTVFALRDKSAPRREQVPTPRANIMFLAISVAQTTLFICKRDISLGDSGYISSEIFLFMRVRNPAERP
jgi:hypothetical protein